MAEGGGGGLRLAATGDGQARISFLRTSAETRALLEQAGSRVEPWADKAEATLSEIEAERRPTASKAAAPPALALRLMAGGGFREAARNCHRAVAVERTRVTNTLATRT